MEALQYGGQQLISKRNVISSSDCWLPKDFAPIIQKVSQRAQ